MRHTAYSTVDCTQLIYKYHLLNPLFSSKRIDVLVVALVSLSAPVEHFICFVEHEHLDVTGAEMTLPWRGIEQHRSPGIDIWLWFEIKVPFWVIIFSMSRSSRYISINNFERLATVHEGRHNLNGSPQSRCPVREIWKIERCPSLWVLEYYAFELSWSEPVFQRFSSHFLGHLVYLFLLAKLLDHVEDPARGARNNLHTRFKGVDVIGYALATNADMHLDIQVVTLVTVLDET